MSELNERHRQALEGSAISPEVIKARGYRSMGKPYSDTFNVLREAGIPMWARRDDTLLEGLLIPLYRATGEQISYQYRPDRTPKIKGKARKYASSAGRPSVVDVHPHNTERIKDTGVPLWITEGVKKADALTSAGLCAVALAGVYNWRSKLGSLGDWEDIPLKGREVFICFDSDAADNPNVARAMARLGAWLRSKGARAVRYIVVPREVPNGKTLPDGTPDGTPIPLDKVGADDFLAHGGTVTHLEAAATTHAPEPVKLGDTFTDARLAETIADEVMTGRFCWSSGLGWMAWDGTRWDRCSDESVIEAVRVYVLERFQHAAKGLTGAAIADRNKLKEAVEGWYATLSRGRQESLVKLCRGIVERDPAEFDADPDLLNTPAGVVNLRTGEVTAHDPDLLMTRITKGSYRPGFVHPDWTKALEAIPDPEVRRWLQARFGQAITGHAAPDDILPILQGGGENGKSTIVGYGLLPAFGDYASAASPKLLQATKGSEHSTELADLRGRRLVLAEEMAEGQALNMTALKRILGTSRIKARYIRQDNIEFDATFSLFLTTNPRPIVTETDHGTWRRLALVPFPVTFVKRAADIASPMDRIGDPGLRERIKANESGQHDAVVTWAVEGARRWYAEGSKAVAVPDAVREATEKWRAEADRIFAAWREWLVRDPSTAIVKEELHRAFNVWLQANNHLPWSAETFHARFTQHTETKRARVTEAQRRKSTLKLSRAPRYLRDWHRLEDNIPDRPRVYLGVRFREEADDITEGPKTGPDQGKHGVGVTGVTPLPVNQKSLRDTGLTEEGVTPVTETSVSPAQAAILPDPARSNVPTLAPPRPAALPAPCPRAGDPNHAPDFCAVCVMAARARAERKNSLF